MAAAWFHFHPQLKCLLSPRIRSGPYLYHFNDRPAVKDAIEACGIPHTEVDVIMLNRRSVPFNQRLLDGDLVEVIPFGVVSAQRSLIHLSPPLPETATFVLDVHLGRLARRLRLLGCDCLYRNVFADSELIEIALQEERIILTRDRGILKQARVVQGLLIRSERVDDQVIEVLHRYRGAVHLLPFQRCPVCNGALMAVKKETIRERLLPGTRRDFDQFFQCGSCAKLYWPGSHYGRISNWVDSIRRMLKKEESLVAGHVGHEQRRNP